MLISSLSAVSASQIRNRIKNNDLIVRRIIDVIPEQVCVLPPKVKTKLDMSQVTLSSYINTIKTAWSLAREFGNCNVQWGADGQILLRPCYRKEGYNIIGQPGAYKNGRRGATILNLYTLEAVCSYRAVKNYLEQRVAHSYSELITIAGGLSIKADDDIIQAVSKEYQQNGRSLTAPTGSTLALGATSLVDIERVIDIYYKNIALEAGIPLWLFEGIPPATTFDSSYRAQYFQRQFEQTVLPALHYILSTQTDDLVEITTPSFRDLEYDSNVGLSGSKSSLISQQIADLKTQAKNPANPLLQNSQTKQTVKPNGTETTKPEEK